MADVFISYSKRDARLTQELALDLEAEGFTTWWDTSLLPGDEFPEQIRSELDAAQIAIVIWTESSVQSQWVRAEADRANAARKLVTLHAKGLDVECIPLPFNTLQSPPATDRAAVFAALEKRGVQPSGDAADATAQAHRTLAREKIAWERVLEKRNTYLVTAFLERYPNSIYTQEAQRRKVLLADLDRWEDYEKPLSLIPYIIFFIFI